VHLHDRFPNETTVNSSKNWHRQPQTRQIRASRRLDSSRLVTQLSSTSHLHVRNQRSCCLWPSCHFFVCLYWREACHQLLLFFLRTNNHLQPPLNSSLPISDITTVSIQFPPEAPAISRLTTHTRIVTALLHLQNAETRHHVLWADPLQRWPPRYCSRLQARCISQA